MSAFTQLISLSLSLSVFFSLLTFIFFSFSTLTITIQLVDQWTPPDARRVTVAHGNATQLLLSVGSGLLVLLTVDGNGKVSEVARAQMEHEVSCVDITPIDYAAAAAAASNSNSNSGDAMDVDGGSAASVPVAATLACVGLWTDVTVRMLHVPSLREATCESLGGDTLARSVRFAVFDAQPYLLVGLGDGHLVNYEMDASSGALSQRKKVALGTQPITLSTFDVNGVTHVFAACDRPTVVCRCFCDVHLCFLFCCSLSHCLRST
jgi:DNA damage-binding protein 1